MSYKIHKVLFKIWLSTEGSERTNRDSVSQTYIDLSDKRWMDRQTKGWTDARQSGIISLWLISWAKMYKRYSMLFLNSKEPSFSLIRDSHVLTKQVTLCLGMRIFVQVWHMFHWSEDFVLSVHWYCFKYFCFCFSRVYLVLHLI